jgi:hypothetical protein
MNPVETWASRFVAEHDSLLFLATLRVHLGALLEDTFMSVEEFERSEYEKQILRLLARGEKEIAAGKGYDLESVLAEADTLSTRKPLR